MPLEMFTVNGRGEGSLMKTTDPRVIVYLQYKSSPRLTVIAAADMITIIGEWDRDWKFPKRDVEKFFIEKKKDRLFIHGKAHYGMQVTKKTIKINEVTLIFRGSSHAPVGIYEGHKVVEDGYSERGFTFKFSNKVVREFKFGKLKII